MFVCLFNADEQKFGASAQSWPRGKLCAVQCWVGTYCKASITWAGNAINQHDSQSTQGPGQERWQALFGPCTVFIDWALIMKRAGDLEQKCCLCYRWADIHTHTHIERDTHRSTDWQPRHRIWHHVIATMVTILQATTSACPGRSEERHRHPWLLPMFNATTIGSLSLRLN